MKKGVGSAPLIAKGAMQRVMREVREAHAAGRQVSARDLDRFAEILRPDSSTDISVGIREDLDQPAIVLQVRRWPSSVALAALTPRERQVAQLAATGLTNREIAARLHLSAATVKDHMQNILRRTSLKRRGQLAAHLAAEGQTGQ